MDCSTTRTHCDTGLTDSQWSRLAPLLGLIISVVVHAASLQDQEGAKLVLQNITSVYERLKAIFGDSASKRNGLPEWVWDNLGCILQPVLRPVDTEGFVVLPKCWIVERTFAWLGRYRQHSKDYERNPDSSVAMIHISMIKKGAGIDNFLFLRDFNPFLRVVKSYFGVP